MICVFLKHVLFLYDFNVQNALYYSQLSIFQISEKIDTQGFFFLFYFIPIHKTYSCKKDEKIGYLNYQVCMVCGNWN